MIQAPIPLIEIELASTLYFSDRDITVSSQFYRRSLINTPSITQALSDLFYGIEETPDISLEFSSADNGIDDTWLEIIEAEELRGVDVTIYGYTDDGGKVFRGAGTISSWSIDATVTININMRRDSGLEQLLPKDLVTPDAFHSTALDVGEPINICIGYCYDVPCPCIRNDTSSNYYDYLIGYGPIQAVQAGTGYGIKRDGVLAKTSTWTLLNDSTYPGYAVIRFTVQQRMHSGGFHKITADVIGLKMGGASAQRNFALVVGNLLSNSSWGLGLTINSASFTTAAGSIATTDGWYCDGCISSQRQARDVLDDLMFPLVQIERSTSGWEATVDAGGKSSSASFSNNGEYNAADITDLTVTPVSEALKTISVHYRFNNDKETPYQEIVTVVTDLDTNPRAFGVDKTWDLPFVAEHQTAKNIVSYLHGRTIYSDRRCKLKTGIIGDTLNRGDVVTIYNTDLGLDGDTFQIESATKSDTEWNFDLVEYDDYIFGDLVITTPTDWTGDEVEVSEPNTLIGEVSLGDGVDNVGTIICNSSTGQKVGLTAAGSGDSAVLLWAGATFANRASAPFRATQGGSVTATDITISGGTIGGVATGTVVSNASTGATHAGTAHAPSNADATATVISGGLITTGTVQVIQGGTSTAGITGNTSGDSAVRFWAGGTFANRASARWRVQQDGTNILESTSDSTTLLKFNRTYGGTLYQYAAYIQDNGAFLRVTCPTNVSGQGIIIGSSLDTTFVGFASKGTVQNTITTGTSSLSSLSAATYVYHIFKESTSTTTAEYFMDKTGFYNKTSGSYSGTATYPWARVYGTAFYGTTMTLTGTTTCRDITPSAAYTYNLGGAGNGFLAVYAQATAILYANNAYLMVGGASYSSTVRVVVKGTGTSSATHSIVCYASDGDGMFSVNDLGQVWAYTSFTPSSEKYKENLVEIDEDILGKINKISVKVGNYKGRAGNRIFLTTENMSSVFPELCAEYRFPNEDGTYQDKFGLDYGGAGAVAIQGVKRLLDYVSDLAGRVEDLESKKIIA